MPPKRIVTYEVNDMEDIDSSNPPNPSPPQTPTQRDFTHNPPLNQSQHSPVPDFFSFMSDLISHPEPDGSVIITADKVKLVANLLGVEKLTSTHTLASLEKITSRIDSIEKSINPSPSSKKSQAAWTSAVKNKPDYVLAQPAIRPPPSQRIINEFKPASIVIRKTVPDSRPFFMKSPSDITKITNSILSSIEAKTDDNTPITIRGVATLPSGDFKFFTQSRFAAKWLLENKHKWTHLCDPNLITPPSSFPVIVHSVPISFTPSNQSSISELCKENNIDPKDVLSVRWLGNPTEKKQSHGHTAQLCKNPPVCKTCGDNHNSRDCNSDIDNNSCFHQSKNLIISVLRSRILYGSTIWATERKNSIIINLLKKIDNLANRIILAPFSHPIKRLIDSEIANSPSTHPSPIHNILDKHLISRYNLSSIETIHPHIIDPWENFLLSISNLNIKKEDIKSKVQIQIDNLKSKSEHLIFTDGSNIPENGSASAALLDNITEYSCRISNSEKTSAFEAEVQAINIGLEIFINKFLNSPSNVSSTIAPINIFCDNQATLFSIANPPLPKSYQSIFLNIFKKFKIILNLCHIPIALFWCPAHVGIPENETDQAITFYTGGERLLLASTVSLLLWKRTLHTHDHV
ncbi:hypothetical protein PGT21_027814 [Puccinia graminis f. sp. tritici]|uniref:Uncharacterized protein n=1 Tax=Puccinia graminis f. sp. tritici TaxID=56615 RepID=A0A5B0MPW2_PUCGR|nr:hypothetical protein PGT21_027814 [Puccinia graminis f. sp. tritici]